MIDVSTRGVLGTSRKCKVNCGARTRDFEPFLTMTGDAFARGELGGRNSKDGVERANDNKGAAGASAEVLRVGEEQSRVFMVAVCEAVAFKPEEVVGWDTSVSGRRGC